MAKRKFSHDYIKYGFTSIHDSGEEKSQCVLWYKILGNHSLRPPKLHLEHKHKNAKFFKRKKACVKRQRLDASGAFRQQSQTLVEDSYVASVIIAKQIKPYTIGETLVKPCALEMARSVLGQKSEKKFLIIVYRDG